MITKEYVTNNIGSYQLIIKEDDHLLYNERITDCKRKMFDKLIDARCNVLLENFGKLHKPYLMFALGGMMWRCCDLSYCKDHRKLTRSAKPLFYTTE